MEILLFKSLITWKNPCVRLGKLQKEVKYGFELLSHFYGQATHYLIWSGVVLGCFFFFPLQKYIHLVNISPGLLTAVLERKKKTGVRTISQLR